MAVERNLTTLALRNQVYLERYKNGVIKSIAPELLDLENNIRAYVSSIDFTNVKNRTKLNKVLKQIRELEVPRYDKIEEIVTSQFPELISYQTVFEMKSIKAATELSIFLPTVDKTLGVVYKNPLASSGQFLSNYFDSWKASEISLVERSITQGYATGQTTDEIVRGLLGTKANKYKDGVLARTRRETEAAVRTSIQHTAMQAREEVWRTNSDLIKKYRIIATLDSRTTTICRSLDQTIWTVGDGPVPPLHTNCRTTTVAELPAKYDFLKRGATRSSKDGYVPASESYYEWLIKQPKDFQDDTIGPTRGKLLREGGLSATEFAKLNIDREFRPLTLDEMRQREPLAFERAGI